MNLNRLPGPMFRRLAFAAALLLSLAGLLVPAAAQASFAAPANSPIGTSYEYATNQAIGNCFAYNTTYDVVLAVSTGCGRFELKSGNLLDSLTGKCLALNLSDGGSYYELGCNANWYEIFTFGPGNYSGIRVTNPQGTVYLMQGYPDGSVEGAIIGGDGNYTNWHWH